MKWINFRKVLIAVLGLLLVTACGGKYPLQSDSSVGRNFWDGNVNPNLDYYSFGPVNEPSVIIGVDRNLVFENNSMWQPVTPLNPEHLSTLAQMMDYRYQYENTKVQGYNMFDDKGHYIGEWYSPSDITTDIYYRGRGRVYISPPSPSLAIPFKPPWGGLLPGQY